MTQCDVLIFVEDPGAANFVVDLPPKLEARRLSSSLIACGHAGPYLKSLGIEFHPVSAEQSATQLLEALTPKLILCGTSENPDTLGLQLIQKAKKRGIPSIGIVDGPANAGARFCGTGNSPLAFAPEWILAADQSSKDNLIKLSFPSENILISGNPASDRIKSRFQELEAEGQVNVRKRLFPNLIPDQLLWVFMAEISDGLDQIDFLSSESYSMTGRGGSNKRTNIVLEEILEAIKKLSPPPALVLRLHPKNTPEEFNDYTSEIFQISQGGLPDEVIYTADLVIGMTSNALFESAIMKRPTLSVAPREQEKEWLPAIGMGLVDFVYTRGQLVKYMTDFLSGMTTDHQSRINEVVLFNASQRIAEMVSTVYAKTLSPEGRS